MSECVTIKYIKPESIKSIYKDQEIEFIRRIDQFTATPDTLIATDNGVPFSQLNLEYLNEIVFNTFCRGTYSHDITTIDGKTTKVAIEVVIGPFLRK